MYDAELSLRDYVQIFLRRWWVVALTTIVCTALALVWTERQTPMYSSSASVLINQANASDLFDPVGTGTGSAVAARMAATEARFLTSGLVSDEAISRLGYEAFVDVSEDKFTDVLTVTATADGPSQAQDIAQTYVETYVEVREQRFVNERTSIANQLVERLAEIDLQIANATDADRVRLEALRVDVAESYDLISLTAGLAESSGTVVIDKASLPEAPFSPQVNRNVALGFVLGLMSGAGLVLLLEALDRSVKSREILESLTPGAPNLAIVPSLGKSMQRRDTLLLHGDPTGPCAEAFRTLRASLQYVAVDDRARVIQVVSAHSGAGKTTVAANLALTLAHAGHKVVVIDGDLRRPRLHQVFGVEQVPGLTSAIIGAVPLSECIQRLKGEGLNPFVLTSGPIPPGPAQLLGSSIAARVIEGLRTLADYVIIDTAPVLPAADTAVLSRYVDASILVVDASKTKRADVTLVFEQLELAGAPIVGTVLNKVRRRSGLFGSGYGYGYGGYQADGAAKRSGLAGWFSRSGDGAKIKQLRSNEIPHIEAAPRKAPAAPVAGQSQKAGTPVSTGATAPKTRTAASVREANEKARSESSPMTQPLVWNTETKDQPNGESSEASRSNGASGSRRENSNNPRPAGVANPNASAGSNTADDSAPAFFVAAADSVPVMAADGLAPSFINNGLAPETQLKKAPGGGEAARKPDWADEIWLTD